MATGRAGSAEGGAPSPGTTDQGERPARPDPVIARILLACVRGEPMGRSLDLEGAAKLVDLAWHHRCVPFLRPYVDGGGLAVPDQVRTYLRDVHMTWTMQQLNIQADLAWLDRTLDGAPWLLFKGPALAYTVYEQPHHRWYGDIDVLVPPERLGEVTDRMRSAGGRVHVRDWAHLIEARAGEFTVAAPGGTTIDLHWRLHNDHRLRPEGVLGFSELYEAGRDIRAGNVEARTLGPADTLGHLALHTCGSGGDRLLWYVDVDRVYRAHAADTTGLESRAEAQGAALALRVVLDRCRRLLGTPVSSERPAGPGTLLWRSIATATGELSGPPRTLGRPSLDRLVLRSIRSTAGRSVRALVDKGRQRTTSRGPGRERSSAATLGDLIAAVEAGDGGRSITAAPSSVTRDVTAP